MNKKWILTGLFLMGFHLLSPCLYAQNSENQWEEAKSINSNFKAISSQPDIEVFSAPNVVMVKANHNVEIRIFTILGKLLSQQHLEPGIYQYHIDSHGIYIIKTNESSCKIAI